MAKYGNNSGNNGGGFGLPTTPGWLCTYGDIMSLLLTFFVLLISFSSIQEAKFKQAIASFQEALGIMPRDRSIIEFEDIPAVKLSPVIPPSEMIKRIRNAIYLAGLRGAARVSETREGIRITIQSPILFDSGKANLRPEALSVLDEVTKILKESPNTVIVEGHTDNVPIHTPEFASNWELSTARAISVARYLFERGELNPARFTVAGYAEYHPVNENDTLEGRQENRRVEILLRNIETPEQAQQSPGQGGGA